ncbi:bifunctional diaminohydroxyphosphoribosylaminopyrimidine deaminase/5-amino-6-(5-phosphoribosylamino)uracil reductase RibD [Candidatus Kaiserbacteria bacterium]|nr:bifunctional diaminohydroxyphosphoribosylaminopyrimidine deaminase/5-amino-6-(5-phosphoribosylamino)uracil reductase RibD [Candidatus Kaiserbacteria bacterium]
MAPRFDETLMHEALRLAKKGAGWTNPNPMVGAVIVKGTRVTARGFHKRAGKSHAEIEALSEAGEGARGATLYVNLEPCAHFGKTPPCVDAIIQAGIKRVVCATKDPNPRVNGKGITRLRKAGIPVRVGACANEARALNEAFFTFHRKKRPFIGLKYAASLDGKLSTRTGDSKWITNKEARAYARSLRGSYQAVLVGIRTILSDDPHLGVRAQGKRDPLRIILDPDLRIPLSAKVLRDQNVLIAASFGAPRRKKMALEKRGSTILLFKGKGIPLRGLLRELRKRNIVSILVEGGGKTIGSFLDERLLDRVYAFYAPVLIGGKDASTIGGRGVRTLHGASRLNDVSVMRFGDNVLISGKVS